MKRLSFLLLLGLLASLRGAPAAPTITVLDARLREPALALFANIVAAPTFPAESLERERARTLIALAHDAQSPSTVAQKTFLRALYDGHPYAADPTGSEESLKRLHREFGPPSSSSPTTSGRR